MADAEVGKDTTSDKEAARPYITFFTPPPGMARQTTNVEEENVLVVDMK